MKKFVLLFVALIFSSGTFISNAQVLTEPGFPECPNRYYKVDEIKDWVQANEEPTTHTTRFSLDCEGDADLLVSGFAKEGHPEQGCSGRLCLAGGRGFEPRLTVPETAVLPLDEPPIFTGGYFTMGSLDRQTSMDVRAVFPPYPVGNLYPESVPENALMHKLLVE